MENLIVCDDFLCRLRIRIEGDPPPEVTPIHAVQIDGLGWIEALPIRALDGGPPAERPWDPPDPPESERGRWT